MAPSEKREFAASELDAAFDYIEAMPPQIRRVQVEVWGHASGWQFVYGDDRSYTSGLLKLVVRGRRFRLRGVTDSLGEDSLGEDNFTPYVARTPPPGPEARPPRKREP